MATGYADKSRAVSSAGGAANAARHFAHQVRLNDVFLPINNARAADYGRRNMALPGQLPGCQPLPQGRSLPLAVSLPIAMEKIDALKTRHTLRQALGANFSHTSEAQLLKMLTAQGRGGTLSFDVMAQAFAVWGVQDVALLRRFWDTLRDLAGGREELDSQYVIEEVRTVIALPEKYQENHDAALLKWKKTKVRPMSGPPIRRTMAAWSYLSVAGQAASSTIASSKVSSQNANSTRNLADLRAAAEVKEALEGEVEGGMYGMGRGEDEALLGSMRTARTTSKAMRSRDLRVNILEEELNIVEYEVLQARVLVKKKPAGASEGEATKAAEKSELANMRRRESDDWSAEGLQAVAPQKSDGEEGSQVAKSPSETPGWPHTPARGSGRMSPTESFSPSAAGSTSHLSLSTVSKLLQVTTHAAFATAQKTPDAGASRYLGDVAENMSSLSLLLETNDELSRLVFDLKSWVIAWLRDLFSNFSELSNHDILADAASAKGQKLWAQALSAGLEDVDAWSEDDRLLEAQAAAQVFADLEHRTTHLVNLFIEMARSRIQGEGGRGGVMDPNAPPPPPVKLGVFLQEFLSEMLRSTAASVLLRLVASSGDGAGEAMDEPESAVQQAVLAGMFPFVPRMVLLSTKWDASGDEVRSAVTKSGKVRVSRITAQASERVAALRSKIEKGITGARVLADSYVVKGHKVFVYAPRQWLRKFARPPTIASAHEDGLDEGNSKKEAGILHKQNRASKSAVEIEKQDPLYWPSIIPHDKGFMRDVDLLKRLDRTPLPAEHLKLYRVIGCEAKRGGEGEELVFNTDGSLLFIAGKVVVLQDGADKVVKEPASDKASGQRFWRGHDQPVSTVTVAWGPRVPEEWRGILAASGQYQAKNLCPPLQTVQQATAEGGVQQQQQPQQQKHGAHTTSSMYVRRKETWPYACVWDSRTLELKGRVGFYAPSFPSDITSLSFSPDGSRLAVLCADRRHTLSVWNWEQDTVIAKTSTHQYPALRVVYNPYCRPFKNGGKELLVTSGRRHIRFWTLQGLEGAAELTGAPAIEPARVKGGEPKLQMWDTTNGQLPLFSSKDERGSNKAQPGAGRPGEVLGGGGIETAEGGVGKVGREDENGRGQGQEREGAVPLRPQGVCMEEAGSMEFLTQRWAQKRPGFLAGRGTSAILDATETSNRNSGVIYHAHFPDDINEKVKMIKIADPGKFNSKWEKGTMLNVIKGRPEFDSKGTTKQDITRMERILVSRPFCCQLHGRSGMFELAKIEKYTTKGGIEYEIPADGGKVMELVDNNKLPQQVALEVLAKRGWAKGVVARYKSVQNLTRNKNSLALGGSLQSSVAYNQRLNVPEYITCGGWYTKFKEHSSGIGYESVPTHYFLAGATDGKIYRYVVDIRTDTAPNVSLEQTEQCHDGPVSAMQVFPDGSFLSGGRDAHLRLWNPEIKIAWTLEKDNMRSEWQLPNPISNFHIFRQEVLGSFEHPRGVDLEQSIIAIMTGNKELHRFPLEPAKYRQLESEWHSSTPFSVVWSWKDALRTYMPGLAIDTTRIHAAAPIRTPSKQSGGGSGGGGTLGGLRSDSHSERPGGGQLTGLALHPIRDEYAVVINGTTGGGGLGGIQIVSDWEIKSKVNMCRSKFLNLEVGALCCDYSVDGSVVGVGLVSGEIVFISSQTASKVHSMSLCASQSSAASPVRKVRFSPCGRLLALALESRDILVLKLRDDQSFSDDSQALKSMMISGTGVGHTEVASGIDWNAKDSPEVPGNFSYVRTSGSCFEIIHWQVNSSGAINQVERVGVKVSMLRDILWQTCTSYVGWEVQGLWTHTKDELTCIGSTNKVISAPLLSGDKNSEVIRQKKLLVTADEQGVLRYMRYPALGKIDMAEEFAHGSSIAEVRFWQNDKLIVSAGKSDGCVFIWKVESKQHDDESDDDNEGEEG